jgi:hypothetical protein
MVLLVVLLLVLYSTIALVHFVVLSMNHISFLKSDLNTASYARACSLFSVRCMWWEILYRDILLTLDR